MENEIKESLFSIGQKIVCVDSSGCSELTEGASYTVTSVLKCAGCGITGVSIGLDARQKYEALRCKCGTRNVHPQPTNEIFFKQTRFVPIEFDRYTEEEIFESLKGLKILN